MPPKIHKFAEWDSKGRLDLRINSHLRTLCRRVATHTNFITTDDSVVSCTGCLNRLKAIPTIPALTTHTARIFTIYFAAWANDPGMSPVKAYSPYLRFTTDLSLAHAIEVALVLRQIEPRHKFAITTEGSAGWYWKEGEGVVELGLL